MIFPNLNPTLFHQLSVATRGYCVVHALAVVLLISITNSTCAQVPRLPADGRVPFEVSAENGVWMKFVWFPPGKFMMGEPIKAHTEPDDPVTYGGPVSGQHEVLLSSGFWFGQTEVTQSQWRKVMQTEPWSEQVNVQTGDNFPATYISWYDAVEFCKRLTQIERSKGKLSANQEFCLPTEAQWEYACRAGTTTCYSFDESEAALSEYAWFDMHFSREQFAHEVASKKPNPAGLYDIYGNCSEWCLDGYSPSLKGGTNPMSDGVVLKVHRGGNWAISSGLCSYNRYWARPKLRNSASGFRVTIRPIEEEVSPDASSLKKRWNGGKKREKLEKNSN